MVPTPSPGGGGEGEEGRAEVLSTPEDEPEPVREDARGALTRTLLVPKALLAGMPWPLDVSAMSSALSACGGVCGGEAGGGGRVRGGWEG